jgi:hypothetical protein
MKITRSAATMNGKFESSSNNQDESNLNRLYSVLAARSVARTIASEEIRMDASLMKPSLMKPSLMKPRLEAGHGGS